MSGYQVDRFAIGKIIDSQWPVICSRCNPYEIRILDAIRRCRTASLGGHIYQCDRCGHTHYQYNSCRNRHCPQCQNTDKERWIMARHERLINVPYYHIVFTLPHQLNALVLAYKRSLYTMLFHVSWETLHEMGWNPNYLGAQLGATSVLHTWGSNLSFHPHIHCIVPGGGVSPYGKWKNAKGKGKFLFPVKALSQVFRAKFIKALQEWMTDTGLDRPEALLRDLYSIPWVVYAKPSLGSPDAVIRYLARYTHKTAITHHRILSFDSDQVTFRYSDYRHKNQVKVMRLDTWEFVRRFVHHFLPKGFARIRHYGVLSSAWKKRIFPQAQSVKINWMTLWRSKGFDVSRCPTCRKGQLIYAIPIRPVRGPPVYAVPV